MKAICSKDHLQRAGLLSEKIAGKNPTLPILSASLVSAQNNKLKFSSTNLEIGLEIEIPAKIKEEGSFAVPAKLFSSLISSLFGDNKIQIDTINNNLVLTTMNTSTTINCYDTSDFPILPKIKEKKSFIIPAIDFISGLKSVYYAASLSEMKPEINSVYVYSSDKKNEIIFVATDFFRLAEKTIPCKCSDSFSFLIPRKSVVEIIRVFENNNNNLTIKTDKNNIVVISDNTTITSRLIEGNFIDYKQIISLNFEGSVTTNKNQFTDSLKTAAMFCGKMNEIKMKIHENEKFLEIQANNPNLGEHTVTVPSKTEGGDLSVTLNYRYLMDCLLALSSEELLFRFNGEDKAVLVTGLNDTFFRYLIMPIKSA